MTVSNLFLLSIGCNNNHNVLVIEVGLQLMTSTVSENQTFPLCAELTDGILERNVNIPLQVDAGINLCMPFLLCRKSLGDLAR